MASDIHKTSEFRVGDLERSFIKIERMEEIFEKAKGHNDHPHRHAYNTVVWVRRGEGSHIIDFNEYEFQEDAIFFVGPGQVHQGKHHSKPEGWVITFHNDFVVHSGLGRSFLLNVNLFRQYSESPPIIIEDPKRLIRIMDLLNEEFNEDDFEYKSEAQGAALKLFLLECVKFCDPENKKESVSDSPHLADFKNLVNENFSKTHKVGDYADMLSLTAKRLNEIVKNAIGITAKDYIIDRIMIEAKRLLLYTDDSVKMTALSLGFSNPLHFNTFFKNQISQTPLQYRTNYRKNR
ncbi:MAG: helix-turn-helix domain-containing protein [Ekhidna sp.]|nr:helix-turn-helix domain-containing protein [Ekhidna sp.]